MTQEQWNNLGVGDVIQHRAGGSELVVTTKHDDGFIATKTYHISSPHEWVLKAVSTYTSPHKPQPQKH